MLLSHADVPPDGAGASAAPDASLAVPAMDDDAASNDPSQPAAAMLHTAFPFAGSYFEHEQQQQQQQHAPLSTMEGSRRSQRGDAAATAAAMAAASVPPSMQMLQQGTHAGGVGGAETPAAMPSLAASLNGTASLHSLRAQSTTHDRHSMETLQV